jgi:aminoglycoside 6'-N-acetyltransferase
VTRLAGERVLLRPVEPADAPALRAAHAAPEVRRWWGPPPDDFPFGDDPDATRLAIEVEGAVAGLIQYQEETDPDYRSASIDIFLHPDFHGRGLGAEAVRILAGHLVRDRGHHRLTIDPAAANHGAIRAYERVGFRPVGIMRRYERDHLHGGWHDGLLMDLLAEELGG